MGRSIPSAAQLIDEQIAALKPMYGALRRADQLIVDEFYTACIEHRAAIANADRLLPLEGMLLAIQLEERKRFRHALVVVETWMQNMERELRELKEAVGAGQKTEEIQDTGEIRYTDFTE
jgi:hypothetical protein